ncbi:MAG TPA: amidohydrolase family protein [Pseudonocardiaceae bacterium]|nr:amidohydrolase family protein [Pseudonocardiaceae bacterium]
MRDVLLRGGRVIDPGTGTDRVADVLVREGLIHSVDVALPVPAGALVLDVRGLVVGPGFIDLHSHVNSVRGHRLQAMDGVTTALELEAGATPVDLAYRVTAREGRPLNYGFSASWSMARAQVLLGTEPTMALESTLDLFGQQAWQRDSSPAELTAWLDVLDRELADGALGIGVLLGYAPRTDPAEFLAVARIAAKAGAPTYTHAREIVEADPTTPFDGAEELVRAAGETGAAMHHCHVNSTSRRHVDRVLDLLASAQAEGSQVTVEAYPYGAGSTGIGAFFLDPDRLSAWGLRPQSIVLVATGERIADADRLREVRATDPAATCILEFLDERDPADRAILARSLAFPDSIVASDAMPVQLPADASDPLAWPLPPGTGTHPRTSGTFAKAIRLMVRETGTWTWLEAFRRCAYLPSRVVAGIAPDAEGKGHLGIGADADIVVLDPDRITDNATFTAPTRTSTGVTHLLVGGEFVVRDGELRTDAFPGRPLRGQPG